MGWFQKGIECHPHKIIVALIIISLLFIIFGHFYHETVQAALKQPIVHVNEFDLDWWSVSHFLLFACFGFIKPGYALSFFTLGAGFELFEDMMSSDPKTKLFDCVRKKKTLSGKVFCNGIQDSYWYSKVDDIAVNLIGYVTGQAVRQTLVPF